VSRTTFGCYLEGQGHSMTFQQNSFRPITLWFVVEFYNYFTGMITLLRQRDACNILVATLKAKVTAWPCSKIVSGPKLCYLKSDFTTTFDKLLLCVQYLFGEHYLVSTGSCSQVPILIPLKLLLQKKILITYSQLTFFDTDIPLKPLSHQTVMSKRLHSILNTCQLWGRRERSLKYQICQ